MRARLVVTALLCLGLLAAGTGPALAASDTTAPVLQAVSLAAPGPFTAGDTVTVQWVATDDAGVAQVQVHLSDAAGKDHVLVGHDGASSASSPVDFRWANGPVVPTVVVVLDVNGNLSLYYPDGTVQRQPGGQGTHLVPLSALAFTTQDTGEDVSAPVLEALALSSPAAVTAGDAVQVSVTVSDAHDVTAIDALFRDSAGKEHQLFSSTSGMGGSSGTLSATVDASWADGPVTLAEVDLWDAASNGVVYLADGTVRYLWPGANGLASRDADQPHGFDFSALGFSVAGSGADTTPPVLSALTLDSPGPFTEGDSVGLHWTATDDGGIAGVQVNLGDGAGKAHHVYTAGASSAGSVLVDSSWGLGTVHVDNVYVWDVHGNSSEYLPTGQVVTTPDGAGESTHALGLASLSFEVQAAPSATMTTVPPVRSRSDASHFGFAVSDEDTPADEVTVACSLDSEPQACDAAGADVSGLSAGAHRFDLHASDPQGHSSSTSYSWYVDLSSPTAHAVGPVSPTTLAGSVVLSWTGADVGTGVASYDVASRTASATSGYSAWAFPSGWQHLTATQLTAWVPVGRSLCFSVRARDRAGNVGAWSVSRCVTRPYDDRVLTPSAGWYRTYLSGLYGGSALRTSQDGASVTTGTVTVRHLAVVATTCASCGRLVVEIAGRIVATVDLTSSTTRRRQLLTVPLAATRTGAVRLRVVSAYRVVEVDGVLLSRV